uniref:Uncharacterized protein n=1 Tax=Meloidogyne enterolobii TaxID=390850 RepID=A0A6V7XWH1_MELEN|nr:unnamed protein product [Meloidogyne enterolobii]
MKSKSIYNIALAVTILLLPLLGGKVNNTATADGGEENEVLQAEQDGRPVGLANHILKKDKVTLAEGSRPAITQEDYEKYKKLFPDACDVKLGEGAKKGEAGYIIVSYSKNSKAAQKGCTLDLYTNLEKKIEFEVFLKNDNGGGPEGCVKEENDNYNDNVLPFAYSHPADLSEIQKEPILGKSGKGCKSEICLEETCIQKTGLELRWIRFKNETIDDVNLLLNPIGSPAYKQAKEDMKKFNEEPPVYPTVKVERTEYSVQFKTVDPETKYKEYNCTHNPVGNVLIPMTWEIIGANSNQKKKHLLVFHFLPQKASRIIEWSRPRHLSKRLTIEYNKIEAKGDPTEPPEPKKEPKVRKFPPNGPECEELRILFSTEFYDLMTVVPPTTTTTTTTTSTQTTTAQVTTEKSKSSALTIIFVIVVVLLCSSCSGAVVYFVFLKKGKDSDGDKSKMDDKGTKSKKDDKGNKSKTDKDSKSANSEAATNSKVKDAEEGKKEGTSSTAIEETKSMGKI